MTLKKLTINETVYGPYNSVEILSDRYRCDGSDLPFVVVGEGGLVDDWNDPMPEPESYVHVPQEVTMRQARRALLEMNYLSSIQNIINNLPSPLKEEAQIEWEYSSTVQRHNEFVSLIGQGLNLTSEDLDNLFILASNK